MIEISNKNNKETLVNVSTKLSADAAVTHVVGPEVLVAVLQTIIEHRDPHAATRDPAFKHGHHLQVQLGKLLASPRVLL